MADVCRLVTAATCWPADGTADSGVSATPAEDDVPASTGEGAGPRAGEGGGGADVPWALLPVLVAGRRGSVNVNISFAAMKGEMWCC